MISRTPAILPITVRHSSSAPPMVLAAAPSEMKITEKPSTKASDEMKTWRPAAGGADAATALPAAPAGAVRIESSETPEMNER